MLVELYIFFELIMLIFFITAFFKKNVLLWAITLVFAGLMAMSSLNVENTVYQFNNTISAYSPVSQNNSYPFLMSLNLIFIGLAIAFGIWDIFHEAKEEIGSRSAPTQTAKESVRNI